MHKTIMNFPNYEINELGEIRNKTTNKIKKWQINKKTGYFNINLYHIGKPKNFTIHRLLLEHFKPIYNMCNLQCNHIDGNKSNNNISNLEWCTSYENITHAINIGLLPNRLNRPKGSNVWISKLTENQVLEIRKSNLSTYKLGAIYYVDHSTICNIKNRKTWKHI